MKEKNLSSKQSTNTTEPNNDFIVGRDTPLSEEIRVVVNRETIKELPTGFYSDKEHNHFYVFGGKMLLLGNILNSEGLLDIRVLKDKHEFGEKLSNDWENLVDTNIPVTRLIFTDTRQIDSVIKNLQLIKDKMKKV